MSLEKEISNLSGKIELLTAQVEALTKALYVGEQVMATELAPEQHPVADEPAPEQPEQAEQEPKAISFEDFKKQCVLAARNPDIGKDKVKEVIARFGAAKAAEIKESDRAAVLEEIGIPF